MWKIVTIQPRHRLTSEAVEVAVMPRHGTLHFEPGQFVVLEVKLESGPRRSPFSIATGHFGSLLDTTDRTRKFLPYHIALSALALALTLVHLYTAVMYR